MKCRSWVFSCLLVPGLALAGNVQTKSYDIGNIRHIEARGAVTVELRQGSEPSLSAEAAEDVLPRVTVDVKGDRVTLGVEGEKRGFLGWFSGNNNDQVKFVVQVPQPAGLTLVGASHAEVGNIEATEFTANLSGASHAHFQTLTVEQLELEAAGASHAAIEQLKGQAVKVHATGASKVVIKDGDKLDTLKVSLHGASNYAGKALAATQVEVEATGASNAKLTALESLKATASGASNIRYAGNPRVQQHTSGASNVMSLGSH